MFCIQCGRQLPGGAGFCPACGTAVYQPLPAQTTPPPVQVMPMRQPVPTPTPTRPALIPTRPVAPPAPTPAQRLVKKTAASPFFLVTVILFCVALLLSLLGGLNTLRFDFVDYSEDVYTEDGGLYDGEDTLSDELYDFYEVPFTDPLSPIGLLPSGTATMIVMVIALWLLFASAKSRFPTVKQNGLTMLRVITRIRMIVACVIAGIFLFTFVIVSMTSVFVPLLSQDELGAYLEVLPACTLVLGVYALLILYYIFSGRVIRGISDTVATGKPVMKSGILFVSILNFAGAAYLILRSLSSIEEISVLATLGYGGFNVFCAVCRILAILVKGAALISMGVLLLCCKKQLRRLSKSDSEPTPTPIATPAALDPAGVLYMQPTVPESEQAAEQDPAWIEEEPPEAVETGSEQEAGALEEDKL